MSSASASVPTWDLNDVSILVPLPKTEADFAATLRATTRSDTARGKTENLIPSGIYDELVASFDVADRPALLPLYAKWTAVSFRIDPCFREHFTDTCRKEIRVAWQPISFVDSRANAADSALHTFYPLSDTEFSKALKDFAALKSAAAGKGNSTAGVPLGIHPGFTPDGLSGKFALNLRNRLKPWIAQSRMRALAVTLPSDLGRKRVFKRFGVYDITAVLRLQPLWLSYSAELEIRYGNASSRGEATREFTEVAPATLQVLSTQDDLREFLRSSDVAKRDRSGLVRFAEIQRRAVDPTKHASLTIDCLTCHATGAAGAWFAKNLTPAESARMKEAPFVNPGKFNLANSSVNPKSLVRFRAFGYEGADVQILDRVINESANVASILNRDFPLVD